MENPGHGLGQRLKKRLGVRVVFRFDFEGASTALSIIGQFDRLAFDGCINRFSRLGSLTFAVYPYTKKSSIHLGSDRRTLRGTR